MNTQQIIEKAESKGNVKTILIEVGSLTGIDTDKLKNDINNKKPNWEIYIEKKPGKLICMCGYEGEPKKADERNGNILYVCPECSSSVPKRLEGKEIMIKSVELE